MHLCISFARMKTITSAGLAVVKCNRSFSNNVHASSISWRIYMDVCLNIRISHLQSYQNVELWGISSSIWKRSYERQWCIQNFIAKYRSPLKTSVIFTLLHRGLVMTNSQCIFASYNPARYQTLFHTDRMIQSQLMQVPAIEIIWQKCRLSYLSRWINTLQLYH